jgi:hypothetical protein
MRARNLGFRFNLEDEALCALSRADKQSTTVRLELL